MELENCVCGVFLDFLGFILYIYNYNIIYIVTYIANIEDIQHMKSQVWMGKYPLENPDNYNSDGKTNWIYGS